MESLLSLLEHDVAPFITVVGVLIAAYQYFTGVRSQKVALVNSIFETLKHNLMMHRNNLFPSENELYSNLGGMLRALGPTSIYPNPSDNEEMHKTFWTLLDWARDERRSEPNSNQVIPLLSGSIKQAFESGFAHRVLSKRVVLNLGHLNFSLERFSRYVDGWNATTSESGRKALAPLQEEYIAWVHFRQYFLLLDLVLTYRASYFSDAAEYQRVLRLLEYR